QDLVGLVGLADARVLVLDVLGAHLGADAVGEHEECEPPEDRGLPVAGAPAAHPGGDVVRALQGGHFFAPSRFVTQTGRGSVGVLVRTPATKCTPRLAAYA